MGGELVHVRPYLGDQDLRCPAVYSWYGVRSFTSSAKGDHPLYLMLNSAMDSSR